MFEYPWLLLLLAPLLLILVWRRPRYFVRIGYLSKILPAFAERKGKIVWKRLFPYFLFIPGMIFLILAAADFWMGFEKKTKKFVVHNYVMINDGSGSMMPADEASLVAANKAFLEVLKNTERKAGERDLVAQTVFSDDAFIVSYFRDDYDNLARKMELIKWDDPPLARGTEMNDALWGGVELILRKNARLGRHFYSLEELDALGPKLVGEGWQFKLSDSLKAKTELIKSEIGGTVFIAFSDGFFNVTENSKTRLAAGKVLGLCQELGIKVYLITVGQAEPVLSNLIRKTGGDVYFLRNAFQADKLVGIYQGIANQESAMTVEKEERERRSYYRPLALLSLTLLTLWLVVQNTISRTLTRP